MRIWKVIAGSCIACLPVCAAVGKPARTGLMEKVEKRLVQLDVSVEGDLDAIRGITANDLTLYVGQHEVHGPMVDPLCGDELPQSVATLQASHPRAMFVLFFDQPHLTMDGRARSLEMSRDLINRLIVNGVRASIVSNAKRLETIVPLTGDREKLLAGVERLGKDRTLWDSYSDSERQRIQQVVSAYEMSPCPKRCPPSLAIAYAREEYRIARKSTERLGITLGTLSEAPAPRFLVYFGDSLRKNAGLHYLNIIYCPDADEVISFGMLPSASAEFDALMKEALAQSVHFFTIQAEGLIADSSPWDTERHRDAQDALVSLAAETGGEAFLGGASNAYILKRIEALTSCRLLLTFPPGDLPRDKALEVTLELHVPKVKIQTQGSIIVPSKASIERSRLLAAFVDPASADDGSLRALLIPRGGDGKTWRVAVQLRLRPSGVPNNSVELGASIVRRNTVSDHFASSMAARSGTRPFVLEKSIDVAPGAFSVVGVARNAKRDDVGSTKLDADWPDPSKSAAAIAPVAVLQTAVAAMSKDGALDASGSLARDVDEMLEPSASTSLLSVVCRGAKTRGSVIVERWLEDGARDEFAPMTIAETDAPCLQTIDVAHAGRLQPGVVDYRVVARIGDEIVAQERRTLRVGSRP